jgi:MFS family permease
MPFRFQLINHARCRAFPRGSSSATCSSVEFRRKKRSAIRQRFAKMLLLQQWEAFMSKHSTSPLPPAFRRLAWSNLAAQSAEQIGLAAAPIFAVIALGAGAGETGLLQTAQTLPFLLMSIPAGVLADRVSRPKLLVSTEALRTVSLLAMVALASPGWLTLPLLAILGFAGACGTVTFSVAAPVVVPRLVKQKALPRANARIELARTTALAGGPATATIPACSMPVSSRSFASDMFR